MDGLAQHASPTATSEARAVGDVADDRVGVCRSATLPHAQYRFYRALLLVFPDRGAPPDRELLEHFARRFGVDLEGTLTTLATHDLVQRDPGTGAITATYPFSGVPKPHHVTLLTAPGGLPTVEVYAMCALDTLGIPLMLRRSALVTSIDPLTGEAVRVRNWHAEAPAGDEESGLPGWRIEWNPVTAFVYARLEDREDQTADTCDIASACRCPVTSFFYDAGPSSPVGGAAWSPR